MITFLILFLSTFPIAYKLKDKCIILNKSEEYIVK